MWAQVVAGLLGGFVGYLVGENVGERRGDDVIEEMHAEIERLRRAGR